MVKVFICIIWRKINFEVIIPLFQLYLKENAYSVKLYLHKLHPHRQNIKLLAWTQIGRT